MFDYFGRLPNSQYNSTNYKSQRHRSMQVRIYDKHESTTEQEMYMSYMVLGVHSFVHFLSELANRKNIKIFIKGRVSQIIHNILWNQYFSYTLLKDIQKTIFANAQHRNSFLKIQNKTYRLSECLQWSSFKKMQNQVHKYHVFHLQGFMADSSMKFLTIQIGAQSRRNDYDLIFEYISHQLSSSQCSVGHKQAQTLSAGFKKPGNNQNYKSTMDMKSYEGNQTRQRNSSSIRYSTQKKMKTSQSKLQKFQTNSKKEEVKKPKKSPNDRYEQNENVALSIKSSNNYMTNSTCPALDINLAKKQNITASILQKKEEKIKQYINLLSEKQKEYEERISQTEARHQEEVTLIKKQIQEVLSSYKKKNKDLRKQNQNLTQMNKNLTIANQKLEEKLNSIGTDMQLLKQSQKMLQSANLQYRVKLQNIQNENVVLNDRISKQQAIFKSEICEKNKIAAETRAKYDQLLGSIKHVAVGLEKQNII